MKKLTAFLAFCLFTFSFCLASYAGQWTANGYLYKPSLGASGQTEYNLFNQGFNQIDTRLSKEFWIGDSSIAIESGSPVVEYVTPLVSALTAIGSTPCTLHAPAGTYTLDANTTIQTNIELRPERGAVFIPGNYNLTINSGFQAGNHQVFSCTGTGNVIFANATVNPYWWQPAGQTDWTASFAAAIAASPSYSPLWSALAPSARQNIMVPPGAYACNMIVNRSNVSIQGAGPGVTIFVPYNTANPVITVGNQTAAVRVEGCRMSGFTIGPASASTSTPVGILLNGAFECYFDNFEMNNMSGDGIQMNTTGAQPNYFNHFTNFTINNCKLAAIRSVIGVAGGNNANYFDHFAIYSSNYGSSATGANAALTGAAAYGTNGQS